MEDQYGISDLRQYINGRSIFQPIVQPPDLLSGHGSLITPVLHHQYPDQMNLLGRQVTGMVPPPPAAGGGGGFHPDHFRTDSATTTCGLPSGGGGGGGCFSGLEMDAAAGGGFGAGDGGTGRWPRQETLTLLEIRSKLDSKFKEANHKGPLWDEVSRIMSEEHGYQRSGKKCREKFENLYKYYKKTKDGKAGRQDGKHYRFFRQLEALYGETSNNNASSSSFSANNHNLIITSAFPNYHNNNNNNNNNAPVVLPSNNQEYSGLHLQPSRIAGADSLSLSNSSDFYYSTSSEDVTVENIDDSCEKRKKIFRKGKKLNWKAKIKDFIDSQMRKLMDKQEVWLEKMMRNIEEKEHERIKREEEWKKQEAERVEREQKFWANERAWIEARDASLMDCLRKVTGKEVIKPSSYNHHNYSDQHHIPSTMINEGILESVPTTSGTIAKKRKEDSRTCCYVTNDSSVCTTKNGNYSADQWDGSLRHGPSPHPLHEDSTGSAAIMPYGGYRYLLGDTGNLWLNNGVKFSKGENC